MIKIVLRVRVIVDNVQLMCISVIILQMKGNCSLQVYYLRDNTSFFHRKSTNTLGPFVCCINIVLILMKNVKRLSILKGIKKLPMGHNQYYILINFDTQ